MSRLIRGAKSILAIMRHKELILSQAFEQIGYVEIRSKTKQREPKNRTGVDCHNLDNPRILSEVSGDFNLFAISKGQE